MSDALKIGDRVLCRFYNSVDNTWNKEFWTGTIIDIDEQHSFATHLPEKAYLIMHDLIGDYRLPSSWLHRKEIRRRI